MPNFLTRITRIDEFLELFLVFASFASFKKFAFRFVTFNVSLNNFYLFLKRNADYSTVSIPFWIIGAYLTSNEHTPGEAFAE